MAMISVDVGAAGVHEYASGITVGEIVVNVHGKKSGAVAALVDGVERDFTHILDSNCGVEAIAGEICGPDAVVFSFGHLGDGNLHVYVLPSLERGGRLAPDLVALTTAAVDELIWSLGGTISAEHGVGQDLLVRLAGQKSEVELDLMRRVKKARDPDDMFNPGRGAHCVVAVPVHPEGGAHQ